MVVTLLPAVLGVSSCKSPYDEEFFVSQFEVEYKDRGHYPILCRWVGKRRSASYNLPVDKWTATTRAVDLPLKRQRPQGNGSSYTQYGVRKGQLHVAYGHKSFIIPVEQTASKKVQMELLGVPEGATFFFKTFDADGGEVAVQVKCNVTVSDVIVPDSCAWMTVKEQKQEGDILNITFTVAPSDHVRARYFGILLHQCRYFGKLPVYHQTGSP